MPTLADPDRNLRPSRSDRMKFVIRHLIPGRVRLHIPLLSRESPLATSVASWVESQAGVRRVRINYACASVIIEYDPEQPDLWARILFFLEYMTLDALRELAAQPRAKETAVAKKPTAVAAASQRWPLAWPTVSLALAFS